MMFAMEKAGPPPQKKLNDKYILGDEIGKGAYGHVYKGLDIENGDFVAIKQVSLKNISQKDLNIIMQEIDLLKNLNHKNIVKYIDSVQTETHLNIILEYIENGSLANIVKPEKFGAFPESLVVVYITQVLEGLLYLHEQGVIHRDIKGANILTTKEGFVKLADFGVATKLTEAGINTYSIVGTPYWMAPERTVKPISFKSQFNFKHRMIEMSGASAASDIWSVGCTVIELLTCEPPYFDIQPMSALFRIVQDDHPPIPGHLSPGLTDFLHQCFQKDAKLRPDAKTLLMHPWIQNSRKDLRPSLEQTDGQIRNIPQQLTVVDKTIEVGTMERHEGAIAVRQDMGNNKECKNVVTKTHFGKTSQIFNSPKHQLSSGKIAEDKISIEEGNSFKVRENGNVNNEIDHDMGSKLNSNAHEVDVDDSKVWGKGSKLDSYKAVELRSLVRMLKPGQSEDNIVSACWRLFAIFQNFPEQKLVFLNQYGLVPLTEMLEVASNWVLISVLQLINQLINENSTCLENVCLMGLIPVAMNLASPDYVKEVRMQVAYFVQNLCQTSAFTLQMFIACRGLPVLVNFFEPDYSEYRDMVHIAVDCIWHVFNFQPCIPRKMLCYLSAKNGAVNRLVYTLNSLNDAVRLASTVHRGANEIPVSQVGASTLDLCLQTASGAMSGSGMLNARLGSTNFSQIVSQMVPSLNTDVPREYLEKVADLLLEFSHADTSVKVFMCGLSLLMRLFQMLKELESSILLKILKCINQLSTDPNCLENLQLADAIKYLIPNLEQGDGPLVPEIHMEVLNALNNLCKINKRRQEEAAENGIIPYLMRFTVNSSPFRLTALSLLCDMAHASHYTREQLRVHNGLDIYLSLLDDEAWSITALDSIAVCLAHDNDRQKMEQILVRKKGVQKLVKVFRCCCEQNFVHILEPFLKIVSKSVRINTILAVSGLTPLLVARLNHPCPISRLSLLKLIKAVYEHHPEPKEFIAETGLPWKLQNLIEERGRRSGEQVLAKQMATTLLKAVYMNTVL